MQKNFNDIVNSTIEYLKFVENRSEYSLTKDNIRNAKSDYSNIILNEEYENFKQEEIMVVKEDKKAVEYSYETITEDWISSKNIDELNKNICNCTKCSLNQSRIKFVFGVGNPNTDVMIVGEAPGADEDKQGEPFVGRAGKLLTDILKAINFTREEVFICNILKCRPPGNRNPLPEEIQKCEPYLFKQIELIKPKFILATGAFAAQTLLKLKEPLGKMRGKFWDIEIAGVKIKLLVTFHPAALLRNPNWKRPTWEDVKLFRKAYDEAKKI